MIFTGDIEIVYSTSLLENYKFIVFSHNIAGLSEVRGGGLLGDPELGLSVGGRAHEQLAQPVDEAWDVRHCLLIRVDGVWVWVLLLLNQPPESKGKA